LRHYPIPLGSYDAACPGINEPQTLIDNLWAAHEIVRREDGESLLWVDRHYVHEGLFSSAGWPNPQSAKHCKTSRPV